MAHEMVYQVWQLDCKVVSFPLVNVDLVRYVGKDRQALRSRILGPL